MVAAGIPIIRSQVMAIADGAPVGRPHIGQALVAAGVVDSVDQAFASYLAGRGPFYVPKADTDLPTAIAMIAAAGGVSVIAHPRGRGEYRALTFEYIKELAGLRARRAGGRSPDHSAAERAELRSIADRLGLLTTGSSDYHGTTRCCGSARSAPTRKCWPPWWPRPAASRRRWDPAGDVGAAAGCHTARSGRAQRPIDRPVRPAARCGSWTGSPDCWPREFWWSASC